MKQFLLIIMYALTALSLQAQKKATPNQQLKTIYDAEIVAFSVALQNSDKTCFESTVEPGWTVSLLETSQRKLVYRIKHGSTLVYSFKVTETVSHNDNSTLSDYEETSLYNCIEQRTKKSIRLYTWERNGLNGISFKTGTRICHFTFASKENAEEFRKALKEHFNT